MKNILILILAVSQVAVADSSVVQALAGTYSLEQSLKGECHEKIDIEFKELSGLSSKNMLGIYGWPRGSGKVVAQLVDVNMGERTQIHENPMSGERKWRKELAEVLSYEGSINMIELEGEYAYFAPNLNVGEFFHGKLTDDELLISSGRFTKDRQGNFKFVSAMTCSYRSH